MKIRQMLYKKDKMRKLTRVIGLVFLMVIPVLSVVAQDNVVDEVVWIVGDDAILKSEVEEQYRNLQYEGQKIDGDPYCVIR